MTVDDPNKYGPSEGTEGSHADADEDKHNEEHGGLHRELRNEIAGFHDRETAASTL